MEITEVRITNKNEEKLKAFLPPKMKLDLEAQSAEGKEEK